MCKELQKRDSLAAQCQYCLRTMEPGHRCTVEDLKRNLDAYMHTVELVNTYIDEYRTAERKGRREFVKTMHTDN